MVRSHLYELSRIANSETKSVCEVTRVWGGWGVGMGVYFLIGTQFVWNDEKFGNRWW